MIRLMTIVNIVIVCVVAVAGADDKKTSDSSPFSALAGKSVEQTMTDSDCLADPKSDECKATKNMIRTAYQRKNDPCKSDEDDFKKARSEFSIACGKAKVDGDCITEIKK